MVIFDSIVESGVRGEATNRVKELVKGIQNLELRISIKGIDGVG